jgi:RNA polymerase sigma factor (sigma-70 family)
MQASLIKSEERKKLHKLLAELTQRERSIITMKYFAEMTNREIAVTLDMKESAVSMAAWRVRQRLREGLQEYGI